MLTHEGDPKNQEEARGGTKMGGRVWCEIKTWGVSPKIWGGVIDPKEPQNGWGDLKLILGVRRAKSLKQAEVWGGCAGK